MIYAPDRWLLVRLEKKDKSLVYKIFGSNSGGYISGDSWRLNSGITSIIEDTNYFYVEGFSGSTYRCYKDSYGTTGYGGMILLQLIEQYKEKDVIMTIIDEGELHEHLTQFMVER